MFDLPSGKQNWRFDHLFFLRFTECIRMMQHGYEEKNVAIQQSLSDITTHPLFALRIVIDRFCSFDRKWDLVGYLFNGSFLAIALCDIQVDPLLDKPPVHYARKFHIPIFCFPRRRPGLPYSLLQ